MDLRISTQPALIGLNIEKPAIKLEIQDAEIDLQTSCAQVQLEIPKPKVNIDMTQCHQDAGYFKPEAWMREMSQQSFADGMEGIARIARRGDALADISSGANIASVVRSEAAARNSVDFNITAVPKQPPEITAETYPVQIDVKEGEYNLNVNPGNFTNQTQWANVKMYLLQEPSIKIECVGNSFDTVA